jgi:hypothetical protein
MFFVGNVEAAIEMLSKCARKNKEGDKSRLGELYFNLALCQIVKGQF